MNVPVGPESAAVAVEIVAREKSLKEYIRSKVHASGREVSLL